MHALNYDKYRNGGVRIIGVRMVDPDRKGTSDIISKMIDNDQKSGKSVSNLAEKALLVNRNFL